MKVITVARSDVDAGDAFLFSFPRLPGRWQDAEKKFPGLPLLVVDGGRRVVCGHDYLLLLRRRGAGRCAALQVDLPPEECLLLNYHALELLFGLNLYEKLLFVSKIAALLPGEEIQRRAGLGFPLNETLSQRLDMLLSRPFRTCLAAGRLGLKTALKLAGQGKADREAQLGVFRACGFSESQQWQLAQMLEEIAFRDKRPVASILAGGGLPGLLAGEMPQRKFIDALSGLRYPAWARREKEWRAWQRRAAGGRVLALRHAPLFAREEVQVTVSLRDRAEAAQLLRQLKKKPAH